MADEYIGGGWAWHKRKEQITVGETVMFETWFGMIGYIHHDPRGSRHQLSPANSVRTRTLCPTEKEMSSITMAATLHLASPLLRLRVHFSLPSPNIMPRPRTTLGSAPHPDHIIKILISTDNHLGYLEKDPVRGDDSFRVFEEVLHLAKSNNVDMLLLGGDLFHDNKPSRHTIVRTMRLLRQYCLSPDGEIRLAVRSDPKAINYMDPCVAVSLPVFVIHGNHDDPTGGAGPDALSALDLLEKAGLITYFGRAFSSKVIQVAPILLQKGHTALALYGLGNIRDEILYDTWARQKRVKWLSPRQPPPSDDAEESVDADDDDDVDPTDDTLRWFNLFVLHQNRLTRGSSKGISDTLLPTWLDYVVWGHEHDSVPDLTLSKPPIVQPGSTVATSLTAGEAKPKHAILLEVYKGKLKHRPVPLYTVRNFEFQDLALSEQDGLSETDPESLVKFLEETIKEMVEKQESFFDKKVSSFQGGSSKEVVSGVRYPPRSFYIEKLTALVRQPLIRLRAEITGNWEAPNPQRFGQAFVGRVASAADILLFYRSKRKILKRSRLFLQGEAVGLDDEGNEENPDINFSQEGGEEQDVVHIPKLVQYFLYHRQAGGTGLKFLELDRLSGAVDQFVNKLENRAIPDYVISYLKVQQDKTLKEADSGKALEEGELLERFKTEANAAANRILAESEPNQLQDNEGSEKTERRVQSRSDDANSNKQPDKCLSREERIQRGLEEVHTLLANNPKIAAATAANRVAQEDLGEEDNEEDNEEDGVAFETASSRAARPQGRGRGRGRGRGSSSTSQRRKPATTQKPPLSTPRRTARRTRAAVVDNSDEDIVEAEVKAPKDEIVIEDSEEEYAPASSATRKRKARVSASGGRSSSRARLEPSPASQLRRSVFASRARARRNTATINVDEESGDDAM